MGYMLEWSVDEARCLLTGVADEPVVEAYCNLLAAGGAPEAKAAKLVGCEEMLARLLRSGMAQIWSRPRRVVPAPPDHALHGVIVEMENALLDRHARILAGHRKLGEVKRPLGAAASGWDDYIELLDDPEEVKRESNSMMNLGQARLLDAGEP